MKAKSIRESLNEWENEYEEDHELDKMEIFAQFEHVFLGYSKWPTRVKQITEENGLPIEEIVTAIMTSDERNMKKYLQELQDFGVIYVDGGDDYIDSELVLAAACAAAEGVNFHKFSGWNGQHWTDMLYPWGSTRDLQHYRRDLERNNESLNEAKTDKVYNIEIKRSPLGLPTRVNYASGTLAELIEYFSYTLEVGASWQREKGNKKINQNPKSVASLVSNLYNAKNNAAANGYSGYFYRVMEDGEPKIEK